MLKRCFSVLWICFVLISFAACSHEPYLSEKVFIINHDFLKTSLSDRNLYQNMLMIDEMIYMFDPLVMNNIFVLESHYSEGPFWGHSLKGSLLIDSPLHYPLSITHDLAGNLLILDRWYSKRIQLSEPIIISHDTTMEYRIYQYDIANNQIDLLRQFPIDGSFWYKLFWMSDSLYILSMERNKQNQYFLLSAQLDSSESELKKIHSFDKEILDIDTSGNMIVTLDIEGIINKYSLEDHTLSLKNQIQLPLKFFKPASSYKILYSGNTSQYLVYEYEKDSQRQTMINSFAILRSAEEIYYSLRAPSSLVAFTKSRRTNQHPEEKLYALENRRGKLHQMKVRATID